MAYPSSTLFLAVSPRGFMLRLGAYTLALAALLLGLLSIAASELHDESFAEGRAVEWLQLGWVLLAGLLFAWAACRHQALRTSFVLAAGLCGVAAIRELDSLLNRHLPLLGWQGLAGPLILVLGVIAWRGRAEVARSMGVLIQSPTGVLGWTGFVTVVLIAQVLGQADAWKAIMGEAYNREFKRTLEELIEAIGYLQLVFAGCEARCLHCGTPGGAAEEPGRELLPGVVR